MVSSPPGTRTSTVTDESTLRAATRGRPIAGRAESLVVVVAHPDDETFGCGSVIGTAARAGAAVTVVCATSGELGDSSMAVSRHELGRIRRRELDAAAAVLGVQRVIELGFGDSGFDGPDPVGSLCAAPIDAVADRIAGVFALHPPDVVVTLDGSDGHRDHRAIRDATLRAVDRSARQVRCYESVLPRSLMRAWVAERRRTDPESPYLDVDDIGRADDDVTDVLDVSHVLAIRERAIAMHASQVSPFEGLSDELRCRLLTVDHLVRVR